MTYPETLDYLYAQLPMFHRIGPAAYKNDLTNTLALVEHLGNPQQHFLASMWPAQTERVP
jgi:dihydrofolate synthase/folylpolyglutamate synthase